MSASQFVPSLLTRFAPHLLLILLEAFARAEPGRLQLRKPRGLVLGHLQLHVPDEVNGADDLALGTSHGPLEAAKRRG